MGWYLRGTRCCLQPGKAFAVFINFINHSFNLQWPRYILVLPTEINMYHNSTKSNEVSNNSSAIIYNQGIEALAKCSVCLPGWISRSTRRFLLGKFCGDCENLLRLNISLQNPNTSWLLLKRANLTNLHSFCLRFGWTPSVGQCVLNAV